MQLCSSPVTAAGIVADLVVSSIADPVGERSVLLDLFGKSHFLVEGLERTHILINNKRANFPS